MSEVVKDLASFDSHTSKVQSAMSGEMLSLNRTQLPHTVTAQVVQPQPRNMFDVVLNTNNPTGNHKDKFPKDVKIEESKNDLSENAGYDAAILDDFYEPFFNSVKNLEKVDKQNTNFHLMALLSN